MGPGMGTLHYDPDGVKSWVQNFPGTHGQGAGGTVVLASPFSDVFTIGVDYNPQQQNDDVVAVAYQQTATETLPPISQKMKIGTVVNGSLSSLASRDTDVERIQKLFSPIFTQLLMDTELTFHSTLANPVRLLDAVVATVSNIPGSNVRIRILQFNYRTSAYDEVLQETKMDGSSVYAVDVANSATTSDYISASGELNMRVTVRKAGFAQAVPSVSLNMTHCILNQ